jgi:DNA polymerase III subunit epsilon
VTAQALTRLPWRQAEFAVVDLETSGLDLASDEILSFAAVPVRGGRVIPAEMVTTLVQPRRPPQPVGIRIHGLRDADLRDQPPLEQQVDLIADALSGRILVAHAAWIECGFLRRALPADRPLTAHVIDTMTLGPAVLAADGVACPASPALGDLARLLNLPVHRPHHADGDALTTAQVFIALASRLNRARDATVGELLAVRPAPGAVMRRLIAASRRRPRGRR